ncbi:hypothetical protein [Geminisphaera colitermitum]|uniref:hypothetical protein n=1 Tax=Geminisphaera colitermitum TaxID=1148786 RepID=UPI000158CE1B|nr:hypothetical protein [Geminisphaera colitermitum]
MSQKFNYTRNPYPVVLPAIGRVTMLFALTFTLATVLAGTLSAAETTLDFSANPTVGAEQKAPDGIVCEISPAPQAVGKAVFKLEWPAHEGKHIAGHLQVPGDVLIDKPGKYKITARVCLEQLGPECTRLSLRLSDQGREIWQLTAPLTPGEPGWSTVSWTLDTITPDASTGLGKPWSGDKNQRLDLPLRLRGFALPFSKWKTGGGALWVDQIKISRIQK